MTTWADPRTWQVGYMVTADDLNKQVRNNLTEMVPNRVVAPGDIVAGASSHLTQRLAVGSTDTWLVASSSQDLRMKYSTYPAHDHSP